MNHLKGFHALNERPIGFRYDVEHDKQDPDDKKKGEIAELMIDLLNDDPRKLIAGLMDYFETDELKNALIHWKSSESDFYKFMLQHAHEVDIKSNKHDTSD